MKMKIRVLFTFVLIFTIGIFYTNAAGLETSSFHKIESVNDDIIIHTVLKGETVYSIASSYNTTVKQIYDLNPDAEKGIKVGDKLRIPKNKVVSGYSDHLIEAKETLYSVAKMYNVLIDDIKNANPGLNESSFTVGKTIKIPKYKLMTIADMSDNTQKYQVQKGETLYSIGKKFNVSVDALLSANPSMKDSGLKEGTVLNLPGKNTQQNLSHPAEAISIAEVQPVSKGDIVRVGIFFSFTDSNSSIQKDKLSEYYQGFLLAVKDLKEKGLNAEIYTFDIGLEKNTKKLESLLGTNEVKSLNLMIGGVSKQQIDILSKFSQKTGIKYIVPFGSSSLIDTDPFLFQMTTSHSNLYSEIIAAFVKKFSDYNIIFTTESGSNDKSDFVTELKKGLSQSNIQSKTITVSDNLSKDLKNSIGTGKNILIPASSTESSLRRLITTLDGLNLQSVSLFGYPEWQAYTQHAQSLHKFDSYIYSIFFLDEQDRETREVATQYKYWYNKNMINSFPKWGYLGYDTGLYFLTTLKQYGSNFEPSLGKLKVNTLQSAINLRAININGKSGGFLNDGIYFVHYKMNSEIEKTDISK